MKISKIALKTIFFSFFFMCFTLMASAQSQNPDAYLGGTSTIMIDKNEPLSDTYTLQIAVGQFSNMAQLLQDYNKDDVTVEINQNDQEILVKLDLNEHPTWTVTDWNNHLMQD